MNRRTLFTRGAMASVAMAGAAIAQRHPDAVLAIEVQGFEDIIEHPGFEYASGCDDRDANVVWVNGEWYSFRYDDATAYAVLRDGEWHDI